MVEILQMKVETLPNVGLIFVSGFNRHMPQAVEQEGWPKVWKDLKKAFGGINRARQRNDPAVVLTCSRHPKSSLKPLGGKQLTHYANVIVNVQITERKIRLVLQQHPFLPARTLEVKVPAIARASAKYQRKAQVKGQYKKMDEFL